MRVFLVNPPATYEEQTSRVEPLGLCYLAAVAKAAGHSVRIHDLCDTAAADEPRMLAELDAFAPDLVGFTAMTSAFGRALELARSVKARRAVPIVCGGWHVSGDPAAVLEPELDFAVVGEGEDTFLELLRHLETGAPARSAIEGLAWKEAGELRLNAPRSRLRDLSRLPRPDRSDLPIDLYRVPALLHAPLSRMRTLTIQASRGCPYTCTFCQTPAIWGRAWARREPKDVVDEIEALVDAHGLDSVWMRDEEFTLDKRWVLAICGELIRRGLHRRIAWGSFCRVDDIDRELMSGLTEAGYVYGFLGVEAGDPGVRLRLKKRFAQEDAERAFALFDEFDVTSQLSWIIGFPWDTAESLERQFDWIRTLPADILTVTYALPFASTEFARDMAEQGMILLDDWTRFSEKEPVLRTPHIPLEELRRLRPSFIRRYYARARHVRRVLRRVLARPARVRIFGELLWHHLRETEYFGKRYDAAAGAGRVTPVAASAARPATGTPHTARA